MPLLAQLPLVPALREGADHGVPLVVAEPDSEGAAAFTELATLVAGLGPARVYRRELDRTLTGATAAAGACQCRAVTPIPAGSLAGSQSSWATA